MNRLVLVHLTLGLSLALLAGCASMSKPELQAVGSQIDKADVDFTELNTYAKRSKAAYTTEQAIRAAYPTTVRVATPGKAAVQYFLEVDDAAKTQTVTVRGTVNGKNKAADFDDKVITDKKAGIPVHDGFDRDAQVVYNDVKPYLKPRYSTHFTGHSLGGAIAAVASIYAIKDGHKVARVITFGQPRFTTAKGIPQLGYLPIIRIVDENDVIPMMPPASDLEKQYGPYQHVGPEVILLEGRHYVYLESHDSTRLTTDEFWRSIGVANLQDHKMDNYLKRLAPKMNGAVQVSYNEREQYVAKKKK